MEQHPATIVSHMLLVAMLTPGLAIAPIRAQPAAAPSEWTQEAQPQQARRTCNCAATHRLAGNRLSPQDPIVIDRTGRSRTGIASYYASFFAGRKMADGARMDPEGMNAASRTLPLGTVAKVTNLVTHRSAIVRIEDRGPYVRGRIVDLSPATARRIGITRHSGIARVRVTPLAVPTAQSAMRLAFAARPRAGLTASELR